ncbi:uncharacterized protein LOC119725918 [Patiria miniata]|uniref:Insulin-like domain-containing protein n=1 Tax=Patiria miniata TaxID=46514 RepID=A0A913ZNZ6_PATMI|nr:uncharacterized protein LOC119725918 [Patiria miniata]
MNRFIVVLLLSVCVVAIADKTDDWHVADLGQKRSPHYCGRHLGTKIGQICGWHLEAWDDVHPAFVESDEANSFLADRRISKRSLGEECCHEGCSNEEVREHC